MTEIVNIAAYKFVALDRLEERKTALSGLTNELGLRGTVLLSTEGINLFLAGTRPAVDRFLTVLRADTCFQDIRVKESLSSHVPHNRMLVKIKKEIIAFGVEGIDPARYTSPRMSPAEFKERLDRGENIRVLDVRNTFEYRLGTFEGALGLELDDFRHFPAVLDQIPADYKDATLVTFCTGGIRCEKAAPLLERAGFRDVYQLDGGILDYFEQCGGDHWTGECFVFDKRTALAPNLEETGTACCFACHATLTPEEQASDEFEEGVTCPHCWKPEEERWAERVARRNRRLREVAAHLPGSVPYVNQRPIRIPGRCDGMRLLEFLTSMRVTTTEAEWRAAIDSGALRMENAGRPGRGAEVGEGAGVEAGEGAGAERPTLTTETVLRAGNVLVYTIPETVEPPVNGSIRILHEDASIVVLDKPAPLPVHPSGRFNRNSLTYLLHEAYTSEKLRPAHRLDANTTGVMVLSRTRAVASLLQPQFERGEVRKRYLARVHGVPAEAEFVVDEPIGTSPIEAGARGVDPNGLSARTEFRVLSPAGVPIVSGDIASSLRVGPTFEDGTTLLEAVPITGRTNQIRAHLFSLGLPVVGDPVYRTGGQLGTDPLLTPEDPPMCLHAARIEFTHPVSGVRVAFEAPAPAWARVSSA
ncbi:MAG: pseudouridine synthase [Candidatus Eisenbacteria bacterium]|uniref:tRNA uridine(34) hydroxylase n=1 Tax=Eiseniibacteriota bacterium TaxID=2212470 RepID=A0A956NF53_UNCEI|nr:pseudouridine synthase [Candidatus Eisenbacteria bacterium]